MDITNGINTSSVTRRRALAIIGGAAGVTGIGYLVWDDDPSPTHDIRLLFVRLMNTTPEQQSFEVAIVRDGDQRFHEQYHDVPAWGTDRTAPDRQNPSTHMIDPSWEVVSGDYKIRARFLQSSSEWRTLHLDIDNTKNIGIDLHFGTRGTIYPSVYKFETDDELATAREFIQEELDSQSDRDQYGRSN